MKVGSSSKVDYSYLVFPNNGVDLNWNGTWCNSLTASKIATKMTTDHWFEFFEKIMINDI